MVLPPTPTPACAPFSKVCQGVWGLSQQLENDEQAAVAEMEDEAAVANALVQRWQQQQLAHDEQAAVAGIEDEAVQTTKVAAATTHGEQADVAEMEDEAVQTAKVAAAAARG